MVRWPPRSSSAAWLPDLARSRALQLAAALPFSMALAGQEPSGAVRGMVLDRDFNVPLGAVVVTAIETGQKATTTDLGNYVLQKVPPGNYTLLFTKEGYVRQVKTGVVVAVGQLTEVNMSLPGDVTDMDEFVVQDALPLGGATEADLLQLRFESPVLVDAISSELISQAGVSDAAGAVRLIAGASVKDGKSAVIRGLPDRYVSSQMNNVRLPTADEDKRAVELDQFPAAIIEAVQVSKTFTPDQQGDASGGAVNVRLRGIPNEDFVFKFRGQTSYNTQVTGGRFLSYEGGGVNGWARGERDRPLQSDRIGGNWDGAVGVSEADAPFHHKWSAAIGAKEDLGRGLQVGGLASFFYERDNSFFDRGVDDSLWVERPGAPMTPKPSQGTVSSGDFKTALFDVTQAKTAVQLGFLSTLGLETTDHSLSAVLLHTRTAEDSATLAEDTRGKAYYFPGHNPDVPTTPGHSEPSAAPYLRFETLDYTERTTDTLQFNGRHTLPFDDLWLFRRPQVEWTIARSSAELTQPDKRLFGAVWRPGGGGQHLQFKPGENGNLGNLQRIFKEIDEDSEQYTGSLKLPFETWNNEETYLEVGIFDDRVDRRFDQETFSNFGDDATLVTAPWRYRASQSFPFQDHPITDPRNDVDYKGDLNTSAWYAMLDMELTSTLRVIGGVRFESNELRIVNAPEEEALWFRPGSINYEELNPGDADVAFKESESLPSIGLVYTPLPELTLRASYNETVARQTFKEVTPILQREYFGGPIFIGNPTLRASTLDNYDLRCDVTPVEGTLLSASWFKKDIKDPIEYVQRVATFFDFTTVTNYPRGTLRGVELEARHGFGLYSDALEGWSIGANATFIDSEVTLPDDEAARFEIPGIQAPMRTRDMTAAPELLYNLYTTISVAATGTEVGLFYTVQGDTLVEGAGAEGNFVPSVYAKEFDQLNFTLSQKLGTYTFLQFQAKNLTNPEIEEVYRSQYIGDDVTKRSFSRGIEYSISVGGEVKF